MKLTLIRHALEKLDERGIRSDWIERTIAEPDLQEPDPTQPGAVRAFKAIEERGFRVLRVVYVPEPDGVRLITTFFDRSRRR